MAVPYETLAAAMKAFGVTPQGFRPDGSSWDVVPDSSLRHKKKKKSTDQNQRQRNVLSDAIKKLGG